MPAVFPGGDGYQQFDQENNSHVISVQAGILKEIEKSGSGFGGRQRSESLMNRVRQNIQKAIPDDEHSLAERMKEAVNCWNSYGSYHPIYLLTFIPMFMVVGAQEWEQFTTTGSIILLYLVIDLGFHFVRGIWAFILFSTSKDPLTDFNKEKNKWTRVRMERIYVVLHFLFTIIFGSYSIQNSSNTQEYQSVYNCAMWVVVVTSITEFYFLVDPSLNPSVKEMWILSATKTYVDIAKEENLTPRQKNLLTKKIKKAWKVFSPKPALKYSPRRMILGGLCIAESVTLSLFWNDLCPEKGTQLQLWMVIDIFLNFGFSLFPIPKLIQLTEEDQKSFTEINPLKSFHKLVMLCGIHCAWAVGGAMLLSWFYDCSSDHLFNMVLASSVIIICLELRQLGTLWVRYDEIVTVFYLWALGAPTLAAALLRWAVKTNFLADDSRHSPDLNGAASDFESPLVYRKPAQVYPPELNITPPAQPITSEFARKQHHLELPAIVVT